MWRNTISGPLVCITMGLFLALPAWTQVTTGVILGVVHDTTGATVADAEVKVRSLETNASAENQTDLEGRFRFAALPVGSYELAVERTGFARYTRGPIVLRLNQEADLAIKLEVAGVNESVFVNADAPLRGSAAERRRGGRSHKQVGLFVQSQ